MVPAVVPFTTTLTPGSGVPSSPEVTVPRTDDWAKTGTSGKIFGSVTSLQVSRAIRDQKGYDIDRKKISINDEVKELGTYKATVDFGNGQSAEIDLEVVAE